jgi:hypothetical protein
MIDFVKIKFDNSNLDLLRNRLNFESVIKSKTGEVRMEKARLHMMDILIFHPSQIVEVKGSLHKCYNSLQKKKGRNQETKSQLDKGYNGNEFNYTQLCYTINYLCNYFDTSSNLLILKNIEFGLNIEHTFYNKLILNNLIRHIGKPFIEPQKDFFQVEHKDYFIKCYDKGKQYGLIAETLRIELKYIKMKSLNSIGLWTLENLKDKSILIHLNKILLKRWDEILLFDYTIRESELNDFEKNKIDLFRNKNFWNIYEKANKLDRSKKRLNQITNLHSDNIQDYLTEKLNRNWINLQKNCPTYYELKNQ